MGNWIPWASQNLIVSICLLELIGQSISFIKPNDLLEVHDSHIRSMENGIDNPHAGDIRPPTTVEEIARKISGQRVEGPHRNANILPALHLQVEGTEIRQELEEQVYTPLQHCKTKHRSLELNEIGDRLRLTSVTNSCKLLDELIQQIPNDLNTLIYSEEMGEKALRIGKYERKASALFKEIENSLSIMQNPLHFMSESVDSVDATTKLTMYNLNDILVRFLYISEKHQLVTKEWLTDLLKDEGHQFIFNYILRRFRIKSELVPVYLNFDTKLTLEKSPFTEELRGILKCFGASTWQKLERLYLGAQLMRFEKESGGMRLAKTFLRVTSPPQPSMLAVFPPEYFQKRIVIFMIDLIHVISATSDMKIRDPYTTPEKVLVKLKLLHNMLRIMKRYHLEGLPQDKLSEIEKLPYDSKKLQEFDESMMLFSDVLKTVYVKYGETVIRLPTHTTSSPNFVKKLEDKIYLTDMNENNRAFSASTSAINHDVGRSTGLQENFIGVTHHQYRLRHLFRSGISSIIGSNQSIKTIILQEGIQIPQCGREIIENILNRLQTMETVSTAHLFTKFDQLNHILSHPRSALIYRGKLITKSGYIDV
ncbi:hypothetical protein H4Q26_001700 [Puccinia striiformis f. sp. tritici PST-130]|nr:hypothetical protein Pst134EB_016979 [Puccinia striiformis f. sp. tritici]KAI9602411.1 hypothetical protein H4Q26_001700 [Puccinia striiformis f. sp. tritici PST-130]